MRGGFPVVRLVPVRGKSVSRSYSGLSVSLSPIAEIRTLPETKADRQEFCREHRQGQTLG